MSGQAHRYAVSLASSLPRGAIEALLETDAGPLTILATHLDHPEEAATTRRAQVSELLELAKGRRPAMIVGDLNAEASAPELRPISDAGYLDAAAQQGIGSPTWPSWAPQRRIDHMFLPPEVQVVSARVPQANASDHLPLVVRLRMP